MKVVNSKKRIEWLDIVKGICMFFIIVAHSGFTPQYLDFFYNSFFLSTYFILSGYLFHDNSTKYSVVGKLSKIIEFLLVPYLLYWLLSYSIDSIVKGNYDFLPDLILDVLYGKKLWFMSCLIVSEIFFALYLSVFKKPSLIVIYVLLNLMVWYVLKDNELPWSISISFMASVFISFGYFLRIYNDVFVKYLNDNKVGISLLILWTIMYIVQCILKYEICFSKNYFGNLLFYIPYVIVGAFSIFYLSTRWKKNNKLVLFLGQNSLLYYFFQNQILNIMKHVFEMLGFTNKNYFSPLLVALLVSLILIIPILVVKKYFPILAGKSYNLNLFKIS